MAKITKLFLGMERGIAHWCAPTKTPPKGNGVGTQEEMEKADSELNGQQITVLRM
jgi:hypothetical protein